MEIGSYSMVLRELPQRRTKSFTPFFDGDKRACSVTSYFPLSFLKSSFSPLPIKIPNSEDLCVLPECFPFGDSWEKVKDK